MSDGVLITGSSGFIGAAVLRALQAATSPPALVLAGRSAGPAPEGATRLMLDLASPEFTVPAGIGTVLHLAGEKRDPRRMAEVNHHGPVRLVEAAARAGVKRFVHLSSVGVYGAPKHAGLVDETHVHTPRNAYELSKDAGERAVRERCAALGIACVVLQPSNVVGIVPRRSYPLLGLVRMVARGWFRHVGRGDAWVNYVAVEDVAAALVAALRVDLAPGAFIVNTPARLRELVGWIADELGVPPPARSIPHAVAAAAAAAGALGRVLLRRDLPFSPERLLELTNTTRYDGGAIARRVGFAYPLGIDAAVRAMVRQYRRDGLA